MVKDNCCSVSVIIPFYNAESTIKKSLTSVLNQTLLPLEIIVVNDSSDHESFLFLIKTVNEFKYNNPPIHLHSIDINRGAPFCRNLAIANAKGKYLAFLDSDDVWYKRKLELQYEFMENNNCEMTGHGYISNLNNKSFLDRPISFRVVSKWNFAYTNPFFTPTVMIIRDGFKPFDESFRRVDDYKCFLENFEDGKVFLLNNNFAAGFKHPVGSSGLTGSIRKMHSAYVLVLYSLYDENVISKLFLFIALAIEFLKFPVRLILKRIRR